MHFAHVAFDTELGPVALATTDEGVVRASLPGSDPDELVSEVAARTGLEPVEGSEAADEAADQVEAFLAGEIERFDLPLDWRLVGGFHREVLKATATIPYGETRSYGEVAEMAGTPGAARAAGTALSVNPIALIVPCHRVIKSDGTIGGYGGGLQGQNLKRKLLNLENPTSLF
ncbi:MAG TPA: methylated-DNA--[protein]-cysteine S-methyltransferase [Solirubrobacterales bacterium]|nr:methylated-DNA--[protein]-cysteine S-methyltransferase [Solirubrobacterales bacterium]